MVSGVRLGWVFNHVAAQAVATVANARTKEEPPPESLCSCHTYVCVYDLSRIRGHIALAASRPLLSFGCACVLPGGLTAIHGSGTTIKCVRDIVDCLLATKHQTIVARSGVPRHAYTLYHCASIRTAYVCSLSLSIHYAPGHSRH